MTVIAMSSLTGAPGVTTAAVAAAVHWPRPVVLVEADTNAASTTMTGFLRSNLRPSDGGIERLALASSRGVLRSNDLLDPERALAVAVHDLPDFDLAIPTLPDRHQMWVIPGFVNLNTIDGNVGIWGRLPGLLRTVSESGIDVIVDTGRIGFSDPRLTLLDAVDHVVVCAEATMPDLNRLYRRLILDDLAGHIATGTEETRWSLLLRKPVAQEVGKRDFTNHVLPVLDVLPHDPAGAAAFSLGHPDSKPRRNRYRSAIRGVVAKLDQVAAHETIDRMAS